MKSRSAVFVIEKNHERVGENLSGKVAGQMPKVSCRNGFNIEPMAQMSDANLLGGTVVQVLALGAIAYQRGDRPSWAAVLPFYGQSPIIENHFAKSHGALCKSRNHLFDLFA